MKALKSPILLLSFSLGFFSSCLNDNKEDLLGPEPMEIDCSKEVVYSSFELDIKPILDAECQSCHNSSFAQGNVRVDTHDATVTAVNDFKLLASIKHEAQAKAMPQGGKLSACEIKAIEDWINDGMPNN